MVYTFVSSGTDNGKQFHTSEEALAYLHQVVEHSKTHLEWKSHELHTRTMAIHDYNITFE